MNITVNSYMFKSDMTKFLQSDDRIFISSRGTYINRGTNGSIEQNEIHDYLAEIEKHLVSTSDIKPFIIFANHFNSEKNIAIEIPKEIIHIDTNNRVTHFILNTDISELDFAQNSKDTNEQLVYPQSIEIISEESREVFCKKISQATKKIANSDLEKVVIARQLKMRADVNFDTRLIISELIDSQPQSYVFSIGSFIGASPELLVEKFSRTISLLPMAGTRKRHARIGDDDIDVADLQTNAKDLSEHAFLVENILTKLKDVAYDIAASEVPKVIRLPHVSHLTTPISATVDNETNLLNLVELLHPTPAVGGTPLNLALEAINELESFDREVYGAPVGWIDSNGDGQCAIALRCAKLDGKLATLFAGVGVVLESEPEKEFDETQAKFGPMRDALLNIVK
jgi:isochorismate synthase